MRNGIARIAARVLPLALCVGAVSCGSEVPLVGEQAAAGVVSSAVSGAIALGAYTYKSDVANQGTSPMTTSAINTHASGMDRCLRAAHIGAVPRGAPIHSIPLERYFSRRDHTIR